MKYEYTYGQEEPNWPYTEKTRRVSLLDLPRENFYFEIAPRRRATWNTAVFIGLGSVSSSSVCSSFTLASCGLYSDELSRLARRLSAFSSTVAWPNWDTVDRRYFIQILGGVIKSSLPEISRPVLLNPEEFYSGNQYPVFELDVKFLRDISPKRSYTGRTIEMDAITSRS